MKNIPVTVPEEGQSGIYFKELGHSQVYVLDYSEFAEDAARIYVHSGAVGGTYVFIID